MLVLVPTSKDASSTHRLLTAAGIPHDICPTFDGLLQELAAGAAAILMPEEAVTPAHHDLLASILSAQPPWSDLPLLILTRPGGEADESGQPIHALGNVTLLERPLRVATLLSAIRSALRARERQYEIREHLADRARAEEALLVADKRKDEFLAMLGHELRNPLAPLLTGLQLLKRSGIDDPVFQRVSSVMDRQVTHLVRLVDDLLEVSRITRGLINVRREPLDLGIVLRSAIETSRPALENNQHVLTADLPGEALMVSGDAVRLTQVFANLLTNAAKYTDSGGQIWLTATKDKGRVVVSVRDNGIGIPPNQLTSVFDMFTQVDRSTRRAQGGLGIGLTLVRSLVSMHGGRVEARSDGIGTGSEFIVELPMLLASGVDVTNSQRPQALPSRRILVVDDNVDAGDMLHALLSAMGATVRTAYDGPAALEALDSFNPDAVLLDIGMPGMDGYEVARRIRRTPAHAEVLLIAQTGWGQEHDHRRSRAAGFDHHMVKPVDIDKLCGLLMADWPRVNERNLSDHR